jgi:hypothetical protein
MLLLVLAQGGAVTAADCPALSYPRTLPSGLDDSDRAHLAAVFREHREEIRVMGQRYYFLLTHAARRQPHHAHTLSIFEKVQALIHDTFGRHCMILNDFFSYRDATLMMFPEPHMDGAFWTTASGPKCTGFNLWIMLDNAGGLDRSFDIFEVEVSSAAPSTLLCEY